MIFENVDALHSPVNAAGKLQLITIGVGPNHGPNVSKYLLQPVCPKKSDPEPAFRVVDLCLTDTELHIFYH